MASVEIVTIGTEILLGHLIDTNSAHLAHVLADHGVDVYAKHSVGDNADRLAAMLSGVLERADGAITTGGLGPTVDDLTKDAVARAVGKPLVLHEPSLRAIEERFRSFGRTMTENNRRQAYLPEGCTVLENPHGTAPGFVAQRDEARCGPVRILEYGAAFREIRVAPVVLGHRAPERAEALFDRAQRGLVQHQRFPDRASDGVLGQIVDGRTEAAGGDRAVGALEHAAQHRREPIGVVADRVLRVDVDAVIGEHVREMRAIGIDQVAEQDLGPDRHDLDGRHAARFAPARAVPRSERLGEGRSVRVDVRHPAVDVVEEDAAGRIAGRAGRNRALESERRALGVRAQRRAVAARHADVAMAVPMAECERDPLVELVHRYADRGGEHHAGKFEAGRCPAAILYRRTATGFELAGVMFTAPISVSMDELDKRIPLALGHWHSHRNICVPRRDSPPLRTHAERAPFGFEGSIATRAACDAAGGVFLDNVYGWMTHVYPYAPTLAQTF